VQSYVSNLRRMLEPGHGSGRPPEVLVTRAPGYLLDVPAAEVDALVLPSLVDEGGRLLAADAPEQARAVLCRALALERGEPLADLSDWRTAVAARSRLQDLAVLAREHLATADTRLGHPDRAVSALEALVAEHPLRERLWARLVEALWAAGRQADALRRMPHLRPDAMSEEPSASTPGRSCGRSSRRS
jgi:DNA-binding SARP family transcriptional activator